jgi:hypothetical protein
MVQAQDFSLTPLAPDLDLNHLPSGVKVQTTQNRVEKRYLSVEKRDQILNKHLKEKIKSMDEFDRDILYKSLISYDDQTLIKKYPFLKDVDLKGLKNDLL